MIGLPVIGLATTEMAVTITNGLNGYVHTDVGFLISAMQRLLADPGEARILGANARATALQRFGIDRFSRAWCSVLDKARSMRVVEPARAYR